MCAEKPQLYISYALGYNSESKILLLAIKDLAFTDIISFACQIRVFGQKGQESTLLLVKYIIFLQELPDVYRIMSNGISIFCNFSDYFFGEACALIKSMTGFGRGEARAGNYKITVEIRSINNRYLEVVSRMPRNINSLEDRVKSTLNEAIKRGRADVFITLEDGDERVKTLKVDKDLALAYYNSLLEIAELCGLPQKPDIAIIAALPGLFTMEKPEDDLE